MIARWATQRPVSQTAKILTMRILLVEDDPLLGDGLTIGLRQSGFTVDWLQDGKAADQALQTEHVDLLVLDLGLPGRDGHEVLRRLRADPATAGIPCISLSANAMPDDIQRALQAGFADYWTKPLDLRAFMRSLEAIFGPPPAPRP